MCYKNILQVRNKTKQNKKPSSFDLVSSKKPNKKAKQTNKATTTKKAKIQQKIKMKAKRSKT